LKESKRKKIGLALGSGGARGFCHIGVLQVLRENNIPIDFVSGCSMGAIVGGCFCTGVNLAEMESIAAKIVQRKMMDVDITFKKQGILKGNRAKSFIKKLLGDASFEDCPIPFAVTATDVCKGELVTFTSGSLTEAIRASFSIPAAFQSVEFMDKCLIDGGVTERVPIRAVRDLGADAVIAVDALGPPEPVEKIDGFLDMIERAFMLLDWQSTKTKLAEADLVITPAQGNRRIRDFKNNRESVEFGRAAAKAALPDILKIIS
jgi:NTE family protein